MITVGVDFHVPTDTPVEPDASTVMLVASFNPMNNKGVRDFVREAWPLIRREVPSARFIIVGDVEHALFIVPDGVDIWGRIDDLADAYKEATVVINPAVGGTGLKIKTVEALAHLRPVVAFPAGVEGIGSVATPLVKVATGWSDFARQVAGVLTVPLDSRDLEAARDALAHEFCADNVYSPLAQVFEAHVGSAAARAAGTVHRDD